MDQSRALGAPGWLAHHGRDVGGLAHGVATRTQSIPRGRAGRGPPFARRLAAHLGRIDFRLLLAGIGLDRAAAREPCAVASTIFVVR